MRLKFTNVSTIYISSLSGIKFDILDNDGEVLKYTDGSVIPRARKFVFERRNLKEGDSTFVSIDTPNMRKEGNVWNASQDHVLPKGVFMSFTFSCEDEYGKTYYYTANKTIPDTKTYDDGLWEYKQEG